MPNGDELLKQIIEVSYTRASQEEDNPELQSNINILINKCRNGIGKNVPIEKIRELRYMLRTIEREVIAHMPREGTGLIKIPRKGNKKGSPEALAWGRRLAEMKKAKLNSTQFY